MDFFTPITQLSFTHNANLLSETDLEEAFFSTSGVIKKLQEKKNHRLPILKFWGEKPDELLSYFFYITEEFIYKTNNAEAKKVLQATDITKFVLTEFLPDSIPNLVIASHRNFLLKNNPKHYSQFFLADSSYEETPIYQR